MLDRLPQWWVRQRIEERAGSPNLQSSICQRQELSRATPANEGYCGIGTSCGLIHMPTMASI